MLKTIRGRLILVFVLSLGFVFSLAVLYWWSVESIKSKLVLSERFEDLSSNVLELRRFEKNYLFYHDVNSLEESKKYLSYIDQLLSDLGGHIERVAGKPAYQQFIKTYKAYKEVITCCEAENVPMNIDQEKLRSLGKELVDFTGRLLDMKRKRIHRALSRTVPVPFALLGTFLIVLVIIIRFVSSRLLKPLALLQETTKRVARGDFSPIPYACEGDDEICMLIQAFNHMARELETNQEALIQSRKIAAIGTLTAGIAHEINNPLNNIYLTGEALLEDYSHQLDPEGKELLLDILNQAERASDIIRHLLDFSRKDVPSMTQLDLHEVLRKSVRLVKNQIMLTGIKLHLQLPEGLPAIEGNLRNLQQVFLNLFLNAIQAMPEGGEIDVRVVDEDEQFVRVDITDKGCGIRAEDLEHIFEPFYTTKGVGRGTGLGLAVTYSLVKKHGGHIEVHSELGKGTTFSVYLCKCRDKRREKECGV